MRPTDPLFSQQWHLSRIGNIQRIWDEYSGDGVHVGVYDDGIQYQHPDLNNNYDPSRHVVYNGVTYDGIPLDIGNHGHGTAVAGLIAAELDGNGTVGVAWGADLTSVNVFNPFTSLSINALNPQGFYAATSQMTRYDVTNHSWGAFPDFRPIQSLDVVGSFAYEVNARWATVAANGRGGLGTVIVKAAGNDDSNCNGDGLDASRFSVSVAATNHQGDASIYSNYGANILVCAPSSGDFFNFEPRIVTTDLLGSDGYNWGELSNTASDYTDQFGGTSAATPIVTGVIALMLDAAPGLGWRDVHNILAHSSTHTGSAIGGPPTNNEDNNWFFNGAANWNGGGMHFNENYGYGKIDAYNAVRMAEVWNLFTPTAQTSANELIRSTSQIQANKAIPDMATTTFTFGVSQPMELDFAAITLSISHQFITDLRISLTSPRGTEVMLADGEWGEFGSNGGLTWTYGMEAFRGENAAGTWKLTIKDVLPDWAGTLHWLDLDVHGRALPVNDVYHYTNEFAAMAAKGGQAGRRSLSDTDGGADWLDAAALSGNASINLNAGATSTLAGSTLKIAAGTVIENCVSGDGNDTLRGNGVANKLHAMRGNDLVHGGGGDDTIDGGQGNDRLYGEAGRDRLLGGLGDDQLFGAAADDWLIGGAGLDRLSSGDGRDIFVCEGAFGRDAVLDFKDGFDRFDLDTGLTFASLRLSRLDADRDGAQDDVAIDVAGRGTIDVMNVTLGIFTTTDFIF